MWQKTDLMKHVSAFDLHRPLSSKALPGWEVLTAHSEADSRGMISVWSVSLVAQCAHISLVQLASGPECLISAK